MKFTTFKETSKDNEDCDGRRAIGGTEAVARNAYSDFFSNEATGMMLPVSVTAILSNAAELLPENVNGPPTNRKRHVSIQVNSAS